MVLSKKIKAILISCAAMFIILAIYNQDEVTFSGLEASRFATVQSLAEQHTFAIDKSRFKSYDRVKINGKFYSDKPLTLPVLVSAFYIIAHKVAGINFTDNYHLSIYLINLFCINILNIFLFILFFRKLDKETTAPLWSKLFLSISLIFSTWLFTFGGSFNNHTPAAFLLFLLFCLLDSFRKKPTCKLALFSGLTAGILLNIEIPIGGIFGITGFIIIALNASPPKRIKQLFAYSIGGAALVLFMLIINYCAYKSILPQYVLGGTFRPEKQVIVRSDFLNYCFHALFGLRGFFSYMPALLLIIIIPFCSKTFKRDKVFIPFSAGILFIIIFYITMTSDYGSWSYGFRYLIPIIPVIWFFITKYLVSMVHSWKYWLTATLITFGTITSYIGAYRPWCNCYEGNVSDPQRVVYYIRNTFLANVLYFSFDQFPESAFSQYLIKKVYTYPVACVYLYEAAQSSRNHKMLRQLHKYMGKDWKYIPKTPIDIDIK
jgi:hypothetical protein